MWRKNKVSERRRGRERKRENAQNQPHLKMFDECKARLKPQKRSCWKYTSSSIMKFGCSLELRRPAAAVQHQHEQRNLVDAMMNIVSSGDGLLNAFNDFQPKEFWDKNNDCCHTDKSNDVLPLLPSIAPSKKVPFCSSNIRTENKHGK